MKLRDDDIIVIVGQRGTGKTTFAKKLIQNIPFNRYIVYDINGEYQNFNNYIPNELIEEKFFKWVWDRGDIILVIDEADLIFQTNKKLEGCFYKIIHLGKHRNIGLIAITRRTANLHKDVISNANHLFIFRLFISNDIEYLKFFMGDYAFQVKNLDDYYFLHYDYKNITMHKPIKI